MKNIKFASRPYMYFSEQGNVDDDATFITTFLVSFNLQSRCLMQSAVCGLQSSNVIYRLLSHSPLGNFAEKLVLKVVASFSSHCLAYELNHQKDCLKAV